MIVDVDKLSLSECSELLAALKAKIGVLYDSGGQGTMSRRRQQSLSWDWAKSDQELATEHGLCRETVRRYRAFNGKPAMHKTKWSEIAPGWDYSKSDTQIARENKVSVITVSLWRKKLGKPAAPRDYQVREVPPAKRKCFDYSGVDWKQADVDIARQLGCTRENVRLTRAKLGLPKRYAWEVKYDRFMELFGQEKELSFDQVKEKFNVSVVTFNKYCAKAGIVIAPHIRPSIIPWHLVNWNLPNQVIANVWGLVKNSAGNHRCNYHPPHHLFKPRPKTGYSPEQQAMIDEEKKKAQAYRDSFKPTCQPIS